MKLLGGREFEVAERESGSDLDTLDVAYFGINTDTAETNRKYAESLRLDFALLSDPKKEVAKAYGVVNALRLVPQRWTFYIGKDGKILAIDKKVNVATHGADVVAKLKELGVAEK